MQNHNSEPNPELLEQHYQYQKAKRRREGLRFAAVILAVVGVTSGTWLGYEYFTHAQFAMQIPSAIRDDVDFPIYLPERASYLADGHSFTYSNGILLFQAGAPTAPLTIAEQSKATNFDLSKFSTAQGLTDTRQLIIGTDAVLFGQLHGLNIAIVDTGQTIVTITTAATQSSTTIEPAVRSLQKL